MKFNFRNLRFALPATCATLLLFGADALGGPAKSGELQPVRFSPDFVGMHTLSPTRHWPDLPFGSIRPAGTSWGALEPAKGEFDWHSLDTWVAESQRHNVKLDYVFVNTPVWASTRPTETCIGNKLGCAAPPNLEDWENFVTALVKRYRGRISSYELWNEPNASGFWTGSPKDMVALAAQAYPIIKSIDPAAIVSTPAVSSTGWPLSHDLWLDQYLAAGGGKYADVIAWHGYAGRNDRPALPPEGLADQIQVLRKVLVKHNLGQMPVWNTEGGWGRNTQLADGDAQAAFLVKWYLINFTNGIARAYWYQWDNTDWGTLWRNGTGLTPAGRAAQEVVAWLSGTTAAAPCRPTRADHLWMCELQKGSTLYRVAWSTSGETQLQDIENVAAFTPLGGTREKFANQPVTISSQPVLIEYKAQK